MWPKCGKVNGANKLICSIRLMMFEFDGRNDRLVGGVADVLQLAPGERPHNQNLHCGSASLFDD